MLWVSVAFALLLLLALLFPFIEPRLSHGRRARRAHRGNVLHWYPNFDEDLRFEPRLDDDIIAISRRDLETFGYRPGGDEHLVPRTFRHRVAGDKRLCLWTSSDSDLRPIWICGYTALQLPGPGPANVTIPPSPDLLARSHSGPTAVLDSDTQVPPNSSLPALDDAWPTDLDEDPLPDELHHDVRRFGCSEGTPVSHPASPKLPARADSEGPIESEREKRELVEVAAGRPNKPKNSRKKRGRRGKNR